MGGCDEKIEAEITKANYVLRVVCNGMAWRLSSRTVVGLMPCNWRVSVIRNKNVTISAC
jgi:hypothetical protein